MMSAMAREQTSTHRSEIIGNYTERMKLMLQRRHEFMQVKGKASQEDMRETAERLVDLDRKKRDGLKFSTEAIAASSCPSCGNTLGVFPYHMRDGRVLCNDCGVAAAAVQRGSGRKI